MDYGLWSIADGPTTIRPLVGLPTYPPSVIHRPQIALPDRRRADHRHRGQPSLPVRGRETLRHQRHLARVEAARHEVFCAVAAEDPVQDLVGLLITDAEVP